MALKPKEPEIVDSIVAVKNEKLLTKHMDFPNNKDYDEYKVYAGYKITTNKQVISILICDEADGCESYGIITTDDDLPYYVGAEVVSIVSVDMDYKAHPLFGMIEPNIDLDDGNELECCFVDMNTSLGKIQFAIYNCHNGYYGHRVLVKSEQLSLDTDI